MSNQTLYGRAVAQAEPFTWSSGANTSSSTATASDAKKLFGVGATFQVIAGTGMTNLVVQIQMSNDGVNWDTAATITLTAPGTNLFTAGAGFKPIYVRLNPTTVTGGSVSGSVAY